MKVSDNTAISMPMRNLISIVVAVSVGVWAFFGIQERLNQLETSREIMQKDLESEVNRLQNAIEIIKVNEVAQNTEFRIKWPRGETYALPADQQQDLLIEFVSSQVENIQDEMESMMSNTVNIKRAQEDINKMLEDIETLKNRVREVNGGH
jgi:prefoldin subunit 5